MTVAPSTRINARLSPELARKVAYLERRLNLSTTELVREAIEHLYAAVHEERGNAEEALAGAGFLACADGPADLSVRYKADLRRSLELKVSDNHLRRGQRK